MRYNHMIPRKLHATAETMTATPAPAEQQLPTHRASGQPDHGGQQRQGGGCGDEAFRRAFCVRAFLPCSALLLIMGIAAASWLCHESGKQPRCAVAVDAVAGLDPATDLRRPTLDPEFNLTVGLASRSRTRGGCVDSTVSVTYRGVLLAEGPLPEICVRPGRRSRGQGSAVAWGSGVRVPRLVRDALSGDLRHGAAEFDVTFGLGWPWGSTVSRRVKVGVDATASQGG
ncbi:hypothetical protein ACP70R_026643 [Stipagrostis hirtigluma subsp. patula]